MDGHLDVALAAGGHQGFEEVLQVLPELFLGDRGVGLEQLVQLCHALRLPAGEGHVVLLGEGHDVRRLGDYSLATGLEGISWYVLLRLSSGDKGVRIGEKNYLSDLKSACEKALKKGRYEGILLLLDFLNGKRANYPFGEFFSQIPGEAHYIPDM